MAVTGMSPQAPTIIGTASIPTPLCTALIILRFISRRKHRVVGADDWVMLLAYFLYVGLWISMIHWVVKAYNGWHQPLLSNEQFEQYLLGFWIVQIFFALVGPTTKIAILLLYRRLFTSMKFFMWMTVVMMALSAIWGIGVLFGVIFECVPVGTYWQPQKAHYCISTQKFFWSNGIANAALDFIVFVMPAPAIWRLEMPTSRKIYLTAIFGIGLVACIASAIRIVSLWRIDFSDVSGSTGIASVWSNLEPGLGIVAGCLATLPGLFKRSQHQKRSGSKGWSFTWGSGGSWAHLLRSRYTKSKTTVLGSVDPRIAGASTDRFYLSANEKGFNMAQVEAQRNGSWSDSPDGSIGVRRVVSVTSV